MRHCIHSQNADVGSMHSKLHQYVYWEKDKANTYQQQQNLL